MLLFEMEKVKSQEHPLFIFVKRICCFIKSQVRQNTVRNLIKLYIRTLICPKPCIYMVSWLKVQFPSFFRYFMKGVSIQYRLRIRPIDIWIDLVRYVANELNLYLFVPSDLLEEGGSFPHVLEQALLLHQLFLLVLQNESLLQ